MTGQPPGVLHVIANLDTGGAQEVVRTLAPALAAEGFRPVVATLRDGPLRATIEAAGVPVEVLEGRRHSLTAPHRAIPELLRLRRQLAGVVARHEVSIIQTHLLRSLDFLVLSLRGRAGVRAVLWTAHNARLGLRADQVPAGPLQRLLLGPKRAAYRVLYRMGARLGDGFVAVSDEVAGSIARDIRPGADRVATIANGVDVGRYGGSVDRTAIRAALGIADGAVMLLSVGKLMRQKGHAVLIEAMTAVGDPGVVVLIAGDGELRADLEARAAGAGIADRLHFLGARSDVPDLLAAADGFVLPSLWEGLPMALLEAMASGLPVLATRVSGTSQVVEEGVSGLLVPPADGSALAAGLTELLAIIRSADRSRVMAAAARDRVETAFGVSSQAAAHARLYRTILERRSPAAAVAEA